MVVEVVMVVVVMVSRKVVSGSNSEIDVMIGMIVHMVLLLE